MKELSIMKLLDIDPDATTHEAANRSKHHMSFR